MTTPTFTVDEAILIVGAAAPFIPTLGAAVRSGTDDTIIKLAVMIAEATDERDPSSIHATMMAHPDTIVAIVDKIREIPPPQGDLKDLPPRVMSWKNLSTLMHHPHMNRANVLLAVAIVGVVVVSILMGLNRLDGNSMAGSFLLMVGTACLQGFITALNKEWPSGISNALGLNKSVVGGNGVVPPSAPGTSLVKPREQGPA